MYLTPPLPAVAPTACSSGDVALTGTFGTADVATSGISSLFIGGVTSAVTVNLAGISDLYLLPASGDVSITGRCVCVGGVGWRMGWVGVKARESKHVAAVQAAGKMPATPLAAALAAALTAQLTLPPPLCCSASGISTVHYSQGQCAVQSGFLLSSPCQQDSSASLQAPTPSWTEGLTVVGDSSCAVSECCWGGVG